MTKGAASHEFSYPDDDASNVVPFPERSVDYAGSAAKLMAGLMKSVNDLRKALTAGDKASLRPEILGLIDRIIETMSIIEAHMDVLDEHSDAIKQVLEPGDDAYFLTEAGPLPLEVVSLIERRQATLMVQKFLFRAADGAMPTVSHNNNRQMLLTRDGCVACAWPSRDAGG